MMYSDLIIQEGNPQNRNSHSMESTNSSTIDVFDIIYVLPFLASIGLLLFLVVIVVLMRKERDEVQIIKIVSSMTMYTIASYIVCNVIMVSFRFLNQVSLVVLLPTLASSVVSLTGIVLFLEVSTTRGDTHQSQIGHCSMEYTI